MTANSVEDLAIVASATKPTALGSGDSRFPIMHLHVVRRALVLAVLPLVGCAMTTDISSVPPYSKHIGVTYSLDTEVRLLKGNDWNDPYWIQFPPYPDYHGGSDCVAELPKAYAVKVEVIKRRTGRLLIGGFPYTDEWAIVSLRDPRKPSRCLRATLAVNELQHLCPR